MNTVWMGFDPREQLAYDVAEYSITRRTWGVDVVPLKLAELQMLTRPIEVRDGKLWCPISQAHMATEFAVSRFCLPFLQDRGWALFVDSDIVCLEDIRGLFNLADDRYAIMCVKHSQKETGTAKMDGQVQTYYQRKNWSSVMLWNLDHPSNKKLTLEMLNTLPGRDLHAFSWLNDDEIGELPAEWNHLVGVDAPTDDIKIAHFTLGGNWFDGWNSKYPEDEIWDTEYNRLKERHLINNTFESYQSSP